jgi:hypothetical protein
VQTYMWNHDEKEGESPNALSDRTNLYPRAEHHQAISKISSNYLDSFHAEKEEPGPCQATLTLKSREPAFPKPTRSIPLARALDPAFLKYN